jgi:hypothetical protein
VTVYLNDGKNLMRNFSTPSRGARTERRQLRWLAKVVFEAFRTAGPCRGSSLSSGAESVMRAGWQVEMAAARNLGLIEDGINLPVAGAAEFVVARGVYLIWIPERAYAARRTTLISRTAAGPIGVSGLSPCRGGRMMVRANICGYPGGCGPIGLAVNRSGEGRRGARVGGRLDVSVTTIGVRAIAWDIETIGTGGNWLSSCRRQTSGDRGPAVG